MYETLKCVALRTVKYDDRHSIVTVWSAERGRLGLLIPSGSSREAARRRALMMPLGIFEGEVEVRPGRELFNIRDVRPLAVLPSLCTSPHKAVVALFISDVLSRVLRDSSPDSLMTEYIFESIKILDSLSEKGTANFTPIFLYKLAGFLGIEPDFSEWNPGKYFDMQEGVFRNSKPAGEHWLTPDETAVSVLLYRLNFKTAERLRIPRETRRIILDRILEYYSLHITPLTNLQTLSILREL